jgi:hypothetical protein
MASILFLILYAIHSNAFSETQCMGPLKAKNYAVYLHGIDSKNPGSQELANRKVLQNIAAQLNLRIALPRAKEKCGNNICWGWSQTDETAKAAVTVIRDSVKSCFNGKKQYGLIGFSSGGYLATKLFRLCMLPKLLPEIQWIVTSGSSMMKGPLEQNPQDLKSCGKLTMLVGDGDKENLDRDKNYPTLLRAKHANVEYEEFKGDHNLFEGPLRDAINKYIAK